MIDTTLPDPSEAEVRDWMTRKALERSEVEVNLTELAEDAIWFFGIDDWDERPFELAYEVAESIGGLEP